MQFKVAFAVICLAVFICADDDDVSDCVGFGPPGLLRERSGYYQGDIILTPSQMQRNGVPIYYSRRWLSNTLIYLISPTITAANRQLILNAFAYLTSATGGCVKFRPVIPTDLDYVFITTEPKGCFSHVGRIQGGQQLNLESPGCLNPQGNIVHALLHALGFWHMEADRNRDSHVKILWENIVAGAEPIFDKQNSEDFGVGYDLNSVMHSSNRAFSRNGLPTIQALSNPNLILGGTIVRSSDIRKLKIMYGCP